MKNNEFKPMSKDKQAKNLRPLSGNPGRPFGELISICDETTEKSTLIDVANKKVLSKSTNKN